MRKLLLLLAILLPFSTAVAANSGTMGFDAELFKVNSDGSGLLGVWGTQSLKQWQPHFGLTLNAAGKVININRAGVGTFSVVDVLGVADLTAAIGLFDFLTIGADLPIEAVWGDNYNDLSSYTVSSLGDLRFDLKGRILEDKRWWPGIAIVFSTFIPTGDYYKFTGSMGPRYVPRLVIDKDSKYFYFTVNAGYQFAKKITILNFDPASVITMNDAMLFGAGFKVRMPVWERSLSIFADSFGSVGTYSVSKASTPIEVLGGVEKKFNSGFTLTAAGGTNVNNGLAAPKYRIVASLGYTLPVKDKEPKQKAAKVALIDNVVYFDYNVSHRIDSKFYPIFGKVAEALKNNSSQKLVIYGYTDGSGGEEYNVDLSLKRAERVAEFLYGLGISKDRIQVKGMGKENPVGDNKTEEGRQKNRRAELRSVN